MKLYRNLFCWPPHTPENTITMAIMVAIEHPLYTVYLERERETLNTQQPGIWMINQNKSISGKVVEILW